MSDIMEIDYFGHSTYLQTDMSSKSTTDQIRSKELLDFTLNKISGVYKCTQEKLLFELVEGNRLARAQVLLTGHPLNYKVAFGSFSELSLNYYSCVYIYHQNDSQAVIKIPAFRSYNPAGSTPHLTGSQFMFLLKFSSALIKSAISGAPEQELFHLKNSIRSMQSYEHNKLMIDYLFIQTKLACYRKVTPPSFPEYLCAQVMKGEHAPREDSKEYLEAYLAFINGEANEIKLPSEYYSSVLRTEKKLSWDLKVSYSELEGKTTKNGRMLKLLPKIVDGISYVEVGMMYQEMKESSEKVFKDFEVSVEKIKNGCDVM